MHKHRYAAGAPSCDSQPEVYPRPASGNPAPTFLEKLDLAVEAGGVGEPPVGRKK
jgi:hypothetical protein